MSIRTTVLVDCREAGIHSLIAILPCNVKVIVGVPTIQNTPPSLRLMTSSVNCNLLLSPISNESLYLSCGFKIKGREEALFVCSKTKVLPLSTFTH